MRTSSELASADALIIPGGESTTIRKLASNYGVLEPLRERAREGLPIFGTCELRTDRRGKTETHGTESAGVDPEARLEIGRAHV